MQQQQQQQQQARHRLSRADSQTMHAAAPSLQFVPAQLHMCASLVDSAPYYLTAISLDAGSDGLPLVYQSALSLSYFGDLSEHMACAPAPSATLMGRTAAAMATPCPPSYAHCLPVLQRMFQLAGSGLLEDLVSTVLEPQQPAVTDASSDAQTSGQPAAWYPGGLHTSFPHSGPGQPFQQHQEILSMQPAPTWGCIMRVPPSCQPRKQVWPPTPPDSETSGDDNLPSLAPGPPPTINTPFTAAAAAAAVAASNASSSSQAALLTASPQPSDPCPPVAASAVATPAASGCSPLPIEGSPGQSAIRGKRAASHAAFGTFLSDQPPAPMGGCLEPDRSSAPASSALATPPTLNQDVFSSSPTAHHHSYLIPHTNHAHAHPHPHAGMPPSSPGHLSPLLVTGGASPFETAMHRSVSGPGTDSPSSATSSRMKSLLDLSLHNRACSLAAAANLRTRPNSRPHSGTGNMEPPGPTSSFGAAGDGWGDGMGFGGSAAERSSSPAFSPISSGASSRCGVREVTTPTAHAGARSPSLAPDLWSSHVAVGTPSPGRSVAVKSLLEVVAGRGSVGATSSADSMGSGDLDSPLLDALRPVTPVEERLGRAGDGKAGEGPEGAGVMGAGDQGPDARVNHGDRDAEGEGLASDVGVTRVAAETSALGIEAGTFAGDHLHRGAGGSHGLMMGSDGKAVLPVVGGSGEDAGQGKGHEGVPHEGEELDEDSTQLRNQYDGASPRLRNQTVASARGWQVAYGATSAEGAGGWKAAEEEEGEGEGEGDGFEVQGQGMQAWRECWHEVFVTRTCDATGRPLLILCQNDVTVRTQLEMAMSQLTEAQLNMLCEIFPRHVLEFMSVGGEASAVPRMVNTLARSHENATILFTDIVGFTTMSKEVAPEAVMSILNEIFTIFDRLSADHKVQKVETAGDCYIVASGILSTDEEGFSYVTQEHDPVSSAAAVFGFAKDMLAASREIFLPHNGSQLTIRIGIHSGSCVSGLVGSRLPKFGIFGDSMNTASRMESTCTPGRIQVSSFTYRLLLESGCCTEEEWEPTGGVEVKGKGVMETYVWREGVGTRGDTKVQGRPGRVGAGAARHVCGVTWADQQGEGAAAAVGREEDLTQGAAAATAAARGAGGRGDDLVGGERDESRAHSEGDGEDAPGAGLPGLTGRGGDSSDEASAAAGEGRDVMPTDRGWALLPAERSYSGVISPSAPRSPGRGHHMSVLRSTSGQSLGLQHPRYVQRSQSELHKGAEKGTAAAEAWRGRGVSAGAHSLGGVGAPPPLFYAPSMLAGGGAAAAAAGRFATACGGAELGAGNPAGAGANPHAGPSRAGFATMPAPVVSGLSASPFEALANAMCTVARFSTAAAAAGTVGGVRRLSGNGLTAGGPGLGTARQGGTAGASAGAAIASPRAPDGRRSEGNIDTHAGTRAGAGVGAGTGAGAGAALGRPGPGELLGTGGSGDAGVAVTALATETGVRSAPMPGPGGPAGAAETGTGVPQRSVPLLSRMHTFAAGSRVRALDDVTGGGSLDSSLRRPGAPRGGAAGPFSGWSDHIMGSILAASSASTASLTARTPAARSLSRNDSARSSAAHSGAFGSVGTGTASLSPGITPYASLSGSVAGQPRSSSPLRSVSSTHAVHSGAGSHLASYSSLGSLPSHGTSPPVTATATPRDAPDVGAGRADVAVSGSGAAAGEAVGPGAGAGGAAGGGPAYSEGEGGAALLQQLPAHAQGVHRPLSPLPVTRHDSPGDPRAEG